MLDFTRTKFLKFTISQQHKHAAKILKAIYELILKKNLTEKECGQYRRIEEWLLLTPVEYTLKDISNRFHHHLRSGEISLKEHNLLPEVKKLDKKTSEPCWPIVVYLDHIRSAHNVGSIVRTVEAFALGSICLSEDTPSLNNKQVKDASMGTHSEIPSLENCSFEQLPRPLIVLETCKEAISLHDFIFPDSFTLVMGNEEYGCSDRSLKHADVILEIPLRGKKNSLNVANAFAIAAYEISRQKRLSQGNNEQ